MISYWFKTKVRFEFSHQIRGTKKHDLRPFFIFKYFKLFGKLETDLGIKLNKCF